MQISKLNLIICGNFLLLVENMWGMFAEGHQTSTVNHPNHHRSQVCDWLLAVHTISYTSYKASFLSANMLATLDTLPMGSSYNCAISLTLPKGEDTEVSFSWHLFIPSHLTQHSISICKVETAKSDICSISDFLFL